MKKVFFLLMAATMMLPSMAQYKSAQDSTGTEKTKTIHLGDKVRIVPYGFVRNYLTVDSRKTYTVIGGEYNMLPYDEDWNMTEAVAQASGLGRTDLNAVPEVKFQALTTRFGFNLDGPVIWGAKTSGKIEGDFGGFGTTNTLLRLRHAYMKFVWCNEDGLQNEVLAGQTWHPLSGGVMPDVLGMAAGAPFRPHSRTPQIAYTMSTQAGLGFSAAMLWQLQYMYNGPKDLLGGSTNSIDFANRAMIPEVFLGLNYRSDHVYLQIGGDMQPIRPRNFRTVTGYQQTTDELFCSFTPTFYFQYTKDKFSFKSRYLYAGNTSHVNQLNGYGVTDVAADGTWSYAPLHAHIAYANFAYGKKVRGNMFLGFMKNVGAGENLYNFGTAASPVYYIYMKGAQNFTHLDGVWRVAPGISYNVKAFNIGLEYEVTGASYGDWDKDGGILNNDNLHTVVNHRICAMMKYNF